LSGYCEVAIRLAMGKMKNGAELRFADRRHWVACVRDACLAETEHGAQGGIGFRA